MTIGFDCMNKSNLPGGNKTTCIYTAGAGAGEGEGERKRAGAGAGAG